MVSLINQTNFTSDFIKVTSEGRGGHTAANGYMASDWQPEQRY